MYARNWTTLLVATGFFVATACQKDKKKDSNTSTSSTAIVGGGNGNGSGAIYSVRGSIATSLQLADSGNVTKLIGMPLGSAYEYNIKGMLDDAAQVDVDANGSFSLPFSQDTDQQYVILAIDGAKSGLDSIVGVVGMSDPGSSLVKMPMSDATGDIELGEITAGVAGFLDSNATIDDNTTAIDMGTEALKETASTDDGIAHIKNALANVKDDGTFYMARPYVTFDGDVEDAKNKFNTPEELQYHGFGLGFSTNDTSATFAKVCDGSDANQVSLVVTPPATITLESGNAPNITSTPYTKLDNSDSLAPKAGSPTQCGAEHTSTHGMFGGGYYQADDGSLPVLNFNFGGGGFAGKMPDGRWILAIAGTNVAEFDMASATPLDDEGKPTAYIPSLKMTTDVNGVITKAEVKFSIWNRATQAYEEVKDTTNLKKNVTDMAMEIYDYSSGCGGSGRGETRQDLKDDVAGVFTTGDLSSKGFHYVDNTNGNSSSICAGESLVVLYTMNQTTLRFDFRHRY